MIDTRGENRRLRQENAILRARLAAAELEPLDDIPEALACLTPQELAFYELIASAKGRTLSRYQIDEALPETHGTAGERDYAMCSVLALKVRRKLGEDVILNDWGWGYRLGRAVT